MDVCLAKECHHAIHSSSYTWEAIYSLLFDFDKKDNYQNKHVLEWFRVIF